MKKRHSAEQIVAKLRQADVELGKALASGGSVLLSTDQDGLAVVRIARSAVEQVVKDRKLRQKRDSAASCRRIRV